MTAPDPTPAARATTCAKCPHPLTVHDTMGCSVPTCGCEYAAHWRSPTFRPTPTTNAPAPGASCDHGSLAPGAPCPVCGNSFGPSFDQPAPGAAEDAREDALRMALDAAQAANVYLREAHASELATLRQRLAAEQAALADLRQRYRADVEQGGAEIARLMRLHADEEGARKLADRLREKAERGLSFAKEQWDAWRKKADAEQAARETLAKRVEQLRDLVAKADAEVEEEQAHARTLAAALAEARGLLDSLVDDDECRLDHHGNCQTHYLGNPCQVAEAREFLARTALATPEGTP